MMHIMLVVGLVVEIVPVFRKQPSYEGGGRIGCGRDRRGEVSRGGTSRRKMMGNIIMMMVIIGGIK